MRCAVIITDRAGRQLLGVTDEQAFAHVREHHAVPKYEIGDLRLTFLVEPTEEEYQHKLVPSLWIRFRMWWARVAPI